MKEIGKIVTVGLAPAWDAICEMDGIDWGDHKKVSCRIDKPAGKALNINRALCWMGAESIAAGLWGSDDYDRMLKVIHPMRKLVKIKFTKAPGRTRENINIVDLRNNRDMHLRSNSELATKKSLVQLKGDIEQIITKGSVFIFSGAMPEELFAQIEQIIDICIQGGARLVIDTCGEVMKKIMRKGGLWLRSGNVEELRELVGWQVDDNIKGLIDAGRSLLSKTEMVLISRGDKGAVLVTNNGCWKGCFADEKRQVFSTVGCGDYLLAGFLKGFKNSGEADTALRTAIQASSGHAWRLDERQSWEYVQRDVKVTVEKV